MSGHIARFRYGVIVVGPPEGYGEASTRPDRETVIVPGVLFTEAARPGDVTMGVGWKASRTTTVMSGKTRPQATNRLYL